MAMSSSIPRLATIRHASVWGGPSPFAHEAEHAADELLRAKNLELPGYGDYTTMSGYLYPQATSVSRLLSATVVHNLFFFIDDLYFDTKAHDPRTYGIPTDQEVHTLLGSMMESFARRVPSRAGVLVFEAFARAGELVASHCSSKWYDFFLGTVWNYVESVLSRDRELEQNENVLADYDAFTMVRERDTGALHTCALIELTNEVFLDDAERQRPDVVSLTSTAMRMASMVNDVYSYHKDVIEEGSSFNLLKLYMDQGASFGDAVRQAIQRINEYTGDFHRQEQALGLIPGSNLHGYVSGLKDMMTGNIVWEHNTNRYRSPESPFPELRSLL